MSAAWIFGSIIAMLLLAYIAIYNGLVAAQHKVRQAWSGIDVQLKRRYDLIPKLVETVRAYGNYEKEALSRIVEARASAIEVPDEQVDARGTAESRLSGSLNRLFALVEAYPDLKTNQNYLQLQREISETEDQIAAARRIYNANVNELNVAVNSFPQNIVASLHGYAEAKLFEIGDMERTG